MREPFGIVYTIFHIVIFLPLPRCPVHNPSLYFSCSSVAIEERMLKLFLRRHFHDFRCECRISQSLSTNRRTEAFPFSVKVSSSGSDTSSGHPHDSQFRLKMAADLRHRIRRASPPMYSRRKWPGQTCSFSFFCSGVCPQCFFIQIQRHASAVLLPSPSDTLSINGLSRSHRHGSAASRFSFCFSVSSIQHL